MYTDKQILGFMPLAASKESISFYISNSAAWVIFMNTSSTRIYAKFIIYKLNHNIMLYKGGLWDAKERENALNGKED